MPPEPLPVHVLMILESQYPSPAGGGAEAQVRTLARALRARGQRATVLTPMARSGDTRPIARVDGVPVCRLRYPHVPLLGGALLWLRLAAFLWTRRSRYQAWHVHIAHYMGAVACVFGRMLQRPVILKVSGWWELEKGVLSDAAPLPHRMAYRCLRRASAWQAISSRIATALAAKGVPADRIVAIPNAVDTARFRRTHGSAHAAGKRFLFVGRLVPEKDLDMLLRAFATALQADPSARLQLVGDGPLAQSLAARARSLGIADRVEFSGHRDDVAAVVGGADVGVLPSRIEGLSNTLLECMSSGLPMVATRISGSEDFVRPGETGWLCEPGDERGLAACLAAAMQLPPEQLRMMGDRARQCVALQAGLDVVLDRLLGLYRRAGTMAVDALPATGGGS